MTEIKEIEEIKNDIDEMNAELREMEEKIRKKDITKSLNMIKNLWEKQILYMKELKKKYDFIEEVGKTNIILKKEHVIILVVFGNIIEIMHSRISKFFVLAVI